ncbi:MAG: V-type ATP synthase subunit D [Kineosporiaceae bacterium]
MTAAAHRAVRHPPGRAGRLWLEHRLGTAQRGAEILDRKLHLLLQEKQRCTARVERTGRAWETTCGEARRWGLVVAALGGAGALRPAVPGTATVEVGWSATMGVPHPAAVTCRLPPEEAAVLDATAALPIARAACRRAVIAAAEHAAATATARQISAEIAVTRGRVRAIRDRWVPRLEAALKELESALGEDEAADAARLRHAGHRDERSSRDRTNPRGG